MPRQVGVLLAIDHYSLFFMRLIFAASFVVAILGYDYLGLKDENREEFYIVLLLATLGSAVLTARRSHRRVVRTRRSPSFAEWAAKAAKPASPAAAS